MPDEPHFQALAELKELRDRIAHGKPQIERRGTACPRDGGCCAHPKYQSDGYAEIKNAERTQKCGAMY